MQRTGTGILALVLLLAVGCNGTDRQTTPAPTPELPPRPETIADTLMIEGMPEPTTARLVRSPEPVSPQFSTYLPQGLSMTGEATGDTAWVRFSASFSGPADPNAYMHVRLYPRGQDATVAREVVQGFLRGRRPQDDPTGEAVLEPPGHQQVDPPEWGMEAHTFSYAGQVGQPIVGRIVLGRRGDRFFHVLTHYPAEFGDGLAPRFDRILHHWRWEDNGEMLRESTSDR